MTESKLGDTGPCACVPFKPYFPVARSVMALLYINREQTLEFGHPMTVT